MVFYFHYVYRGYHYTHIMYRNARTTHPLQWPRSCTPSHPRIGGHRQRWSTHKSASHVWKGTQWWLIFCLHWSIFLKYFFFYLDLVRAFGFAKKLGFFLRTACCRDLDSLLGWMDEKWRRKCGCGVFMCCIVAYKDMDTVRKFIGWHYKSLRCT
jgi:hypothetical protein